jgi:hypothetical protein
MPRISPCIVSLHGLVGGAREHGRQERKKEDGNVSTAEK